MCEAGLVRFDAGVLCSYQAIVYEASQRSIGSTPVYLREMAAWVRDLCADPQMRYTTPHVQQLGKAVMSSTQATRP